MDGRGQGFISLDVTGTTREVTAYLCSVGT